MYAAEPDPYCYPGTTVLKNLLDLRDAEDLEAFEADAVTQRSEEPLPIGDPSPSYYQAIHHHLFQDVYHWAGTFRTVRLSKGSSVFCYPENIDAQLRKLFEWLRQEKDLQDIAADEFAQKAAHLLSELNVIHPFREGNGRTQMVFLGLIAERSGHPLDLDTLNPDEFLQAMITAFRGSEAPLTEAIRRMV